MNEEWEYKQKFIYKSGDLLLARRRQSLRRARGMKAQLYPEFNPDRLYKDGVPVFPETPSIQMISPYHTGFQFYKKNLKNNEKEENGLEKYLRLKLNPIR